VELTPVGPTMRRLGVNTIVPGVRYVVLLLTTDLV
jgi:hypothetical protein